MATVRGLSVNTIELAHPLGEVRIRRLYHQMVVIAHQTVGMANPVKPFHHLRQYLEKTLSILIIFVDGLVPVSAGSYMIKRTIELNAQRSCHDRLYSERSKPHVSMRDLTPIPLLYEKTDPDVRKVMVSIKDFCANHAKTRNCTAKIPPFLKMEPFSALKSSNN